MKQYVTYVGSSQHLRDSVDGIGTSMYSEASVTQLTTKQKLQNTRLIQNTM